MILITSGDRQIYNPGNPYLKLINPKLSLEDNAAGCLTFKIYETNRNYDAVKKLHPIISVIRDNQTIFKGRVITDTRDFYNGKSVEAEGKLAFLNDSYVEPFSFSGAPEELFKMFIENHNAQVKEWQQFQIGVVTVKDANDYIVRSSEFMLNTWEALKEKCFQSSLGGHLRIRYEKDGDYVDWLADYEKVSSQSIEFARNMMNMSLTVDATETYTAIRPIGAEVEGNKIDISSVNDGKKYLVNEEKAAEYGIIYAPESESTWSDVTLPENLLRKAKEKLYGTFIALSETYEISAIDLNLTNEDIETLNICEYVPVKSKMHNIDERYLLNRADICIDAPQNSVYYLGASKRTFSDANSNKVIKSTEIPKDISAFRNDAKYVSEEQAEELLAGYTTETDVEVIVSQHIEKIPAGKDGADGADGQNGLSAYEIAVENGFEGTEAEWLESLKGETGADGAKGEDGKTPVIKIGTIKTGAPGTNAVVTNSGTGTEVILNFTIPRGDKGEPGGGGEGGAEIILTKYDTAVNEFSYFNQQGIYSPLVIEANPNWTELEGFVFIAVTSEFTPIIKTVQEERKDVL